MDLPTELVERIRLVCSLLHLPAGLPGAVRRPVTVTRDKRGVLPNDARIRQAPGPVARYCCGCRPLHPPQCSNSRSKSSNREPHRRQAVRAHRHASAAPAPPEPASQGPSRTCSAAHQHAPGQHPPRTVQLTADGRQRGRRIGFQANQCRFSAPVPTATPAWGRVADDDASPCQFWASVGLDSLCLFVGRKGLCVCLPDRVDLPGSKVRCVSGEGM